jgi:hypothetical protein
MDELMGKIRWWGRLTIKEEEEVIDAKALVGGLGCL